MIRIVFPYHLRLLARTDVDVQLDARGPVTQRSVLDPLEARYPALQGTIRDHDTRERRPSCVSSPASWICRTTCRMSHFLMRWLLEWNPSLSSGRSPADDAPESRTGLFVKYVTGIDVADAAATVSERSGDIRPDTMINRHTARLLTRAALLVTMYQSARWIHEHRRKNQQN